MGLEITLSAATTVVVVPQETKSITTFTIDRLVDLPTQKIVRAFVNEIPTPIILWESAAYDAIGQWTDASVIARIKELYGG